MRHPELDKVIQEAEEAALDLAEDALIALVRKGHPSSVQFFLP